MSQLPAQYRDDLDGTVVSEDQVKKGVYITVGTRKGKKALDLRPEMEAALIALSDGDPDLVRAVFTPRVEAARKVRTPEEMAAIRKAATEAKNADGSPMFENVKAKGRQPEVVYTWYYNEYLPAQQSPTAA